MRNFFAADALVDWYHRNARVLPWRSNPRPWHVLLSELMLQQTRVDTVIPYYLRFLERWPTVEAFASAPLEEVLEAWAGLGYYRRARHLHAAATAAAARGGIPRDYEALLLLPGVGAYTAGAVASIAYEIAVPAVDGNVERVFSRCLAYGGRVNSAEGKQVIREAAARLLDGHSPRAVNQAIMELGATVCTPRAPRCGECPLSEECRAALAGAAEKYPIKAAKSPPRAVRAVAAWVEGPEGVLLAKRPEHGLLAGMWELPCGEWDGSGDPPEVLRELLAVRVGISARIGRRLGAVRHLFTHRHLDLEVYLVADWLGSPRASESYPAVTWARSPYAGLPLSTLARKTLALRVLNDIAPLFAAEEEL